MPKHEYDAIVVGSGPNGLAAGIKLLLAGYSVLLIEAKATIGGGMRSAELTLPGFVHDICSAVHPLGIGSPFFRQLPLSKFGLEWVHPLIPAVHPFDDGSVASLEKTIEATSQSLGGDGAAYHRLMEPFVRKWSQLEDTLLGPFGFPSHPISVVSFAFAALRSAESFVNKHFQGSRARGLFAGLAAHSILPLDNRITAAVALVLGILGHVYGWPVPKGGTQKIADALGGYFTSLGGVIATDWEVQSLRDLPPSKVVLLDVTPRQLLRIAGDCLTNKYAEKLKKFRYGPGVFKVDWALDGPIPWKDKECLKAGTVHVGGTFEEIALSEKLVWQGEHPKKPFLILAQQSLFDPTRAPSGKQVVWAYCHVPSGSAFDMTERMERQIERFAPGFRDRVLARSVKSPLDMEAYNPNYINGDIIGGVQDLGQLLTRPAGLFHPYATSDKELFICSSSTPPGGGVHGMCGYHAALAAIETLRS